MNYRLRLTVIGLTALLALCGCQPTPAEPTKVDGVAATDRLSSMRPGVAPGPGAK